jgi:PAS domain S-box-containing protein
MKSYNYKGVLKYTTLGIMLGVMMVVNAWLLNRQRGFDGPWFHIFDYSPDFIIISLSPILLGLLFCFIGIRWQQLLAFNEHIKQNLSEEQIHSLKADHQSKLLASIVAQINEAVVISDKNGCIQWVNEGFTSITGYCLNEVEGKSPDNLFFGPLTDKSLVKSLEEDLFKGESVVDELILYRKDGSAYWAMVSIKPIHDETGDVTSYIAIKSDVTNRKEKEVAIESLYKEVADYKFALDQSSIVIIFDFSGKILHVNKKFCDINGLVRKEEAENNFANISFDMWEEEVQLAIWEKLNEGKMWKGELINNCRNGKRYWADTTIVPLLTNEKGQKQFLAIQNDITERKELEQQILESKNKLEQAMKIAAFGAWEVKLPGNELYLSKELRDIYHLPQNSAYTIEDIFSHIHPDDMPTVNDCIAIASTGVKTELEYRFVINGHDRYMTSNIAPLHNEHGELTGYFGTVKDITERKLTILALKKSEEEKAAVLDNTQTIICQHDLDGVIINVNPAVEKLSGFKKEELVGKSLEMLISPEYRFQFKYYLSEIIEKKAASGSLQIITKDGKKKAWLYQNALYSVDSKPYIIASATDITDTIKAKNEVERQQHFISQIIDNSPNVIFVMNEQKEIILANKVFRQYYNFGESETPLASDLCRGDNDIFLGDIESLLDLDDGEVIRLEGCMQHAGGDTVNWFNIIKKCFFEKKGKKYILGFGMDITGRYQVESDLIAANEMVERSLKVKDQFISNMSHEIRTPLNAVIGFSDLLVGTPLNEEQSGYVKIVKAAGRNLLALINNILDMSKLESGRLVLENLPIQLDQVVSDAVKLLEPKAKDKGIQLRCNLAANLPAKVLGDQLRISQICYNLIGNAIKFTDVGFVEMNCKMVNGPDDQKQYISFSVRDTGIGVPLEKQAIIFERFTQATQDTERLYGGTGLGLNIAKSIVDLHGGTLTMESTPNKGTIFHFILPFNKCEVEDATLNNTELQNIQHSKQECMQQLNILLAEDNMINAMLARQVLEKEGHKVTHVINGALAVETVQQRKFDIVLMDIQMPVLNGLQATKAIRELNCEDVDIPIVAMTAHSLYGEMQSCYNAGMNGYVSKPFQPENLFAAIYEAISKRKETNAAASL